MAAIEGLPVDPGDFAKREQQGVGAVEHALAGAHAAHRGGRLPAGDHQRSAAHAERRAAAGRRARSGERAALPGRARRERARPEALSRRDDRASPADRDGPRADRPRRRALPERRGRARPVPRSPRARGAARAGKGGAGGGAQRFSRTQARPLLGPGAPVRGRARGASFAAARGAGRRARRAQLQAEDRHRARQHRDATRSSSTGSTARRATSSVTSRSATSALVRDRLRGIVLRADVGHHRAGVGGPRGGARPRAQPAGASARGRSSSSTRS